MVSLESAFYSLFDPSLWVKEGLRGTEVVRGAWGKVWVISCLPKVKEGSSGEHGQGEKEGGGTQGCGTLLLFIPHFQAESTSYAGLLRKEWGHEGSHVSPSRHPGRRVIGGELSKDQRKVSTFQSSLKRESWANVNSSGEKKLFLYRPAKSIGYGYTGQVLGATLQITWV